MSGDRRYTCQIHGAEGRAVVRRVMRSPRGMAPWRDGILELDREAFDDLVHLGTVSEDDGAIVYADDSGRANSHAVPRVRFGADLYPVMESP